MLNNKCCKEKYVKNKNIRRKFFERKMVVIFFISLGEDFFFLEKEFIKEKIELFILIF